MITILIALVVSFLVVVLPMPSTIRLLKENRSVGSDVHKHDKPEVPKGAGFLILFAIVSGVFLLLLVLFWQKSAYTIAPLNTVPSLLLRSVFFLSFGGFYWGARALSSFDTFGITPVLRNMRGMDPPQSMPFVVRGPYRFVRHPIYFFSLLLIWSCPDLSADRLLFNILFTAWMIVATLLEERDLIADFGEAYQDYKRKVPMLVPWRIPRRNSA